MNRTEHFSSPIYGDNISLFNKFHTIHFTLKLSFLKKNMECIVNIPSTFRKQHKLGEWVLSMHTLMMNILSQNGLFKSHVEQHSIICFLMFEQLEDFVTIFQIVLKWLIYIYRWNYIFMKCNIVCFTIAEKIEKIVQLNLKCFSFC